MTEEAMVTDEPSPSPPAIKRDSLNGIWVLDKNRGQWSMRGYLETLHVNELAIQAHEKGELDHDTFHSISLSDDKVQIIKRSRVNNDLVVELTIGEESVEYLQPGDRAKKSLATTENPSSQHHHVQIQSSLLTMNGMAHVTDIKRLVQEGDKSVMTQELTIVNEETGKSNTTTRYFYPQDEPLESLEQAPPTPPAAGGES
jgi:hypothetical protein